MDPVTWRFPQPETFTLDNGLRVLLADMPGRHVATAALSIGLPTTAVERPETEGVVAAYAALLNADAPHHRDGTVGALALAGGMVTTRCGHRGPIVMGDCPAAELPRLFEAMAATVHPFTPTTRSFEALRRQVVAERAMESDDPIALGNKLIHESVLAPGSRYGRPLGGTEKAWRALTLDDVTAVVPGAARMTLIVAGDLAGTGAADAAAKAFDGVPAGDDLPLADVPPLPADRPGRAHRPGRGGPQTRLVLGCFAVDRLDPRWPSARVAGELLGGGPDSLLNRELRGRMGASYGIEARFMPFFSGGVFVVSGFVDAARAPAAAEAITRVLTRFREGDVDGGLVTRVRDRMLAAAPELYESTLAVTQQYAELLSCGIDPPAYVDRHLGLMGALDAGRVTADFASLVDPALLHTVAVGRFETG
ncbi:hypothetical protein GT755_21460 [Herbidospora sp. NEAU-GS84]|uniref:Peptidase M16 C-terminal domain-containing protein n=1 Tax=Herbidospora solisilvae TaxID=2696284 RepID=A0A7C9MYP5_9ACTN|nr:insulinase family protein [Herbidospora solisilvae]NAS24251.1 hypothetical protein [Herbidospora solisilvae]